MKEKNIENINPINLTEQNIDFNSNLNIQRSKSPQNNIINKLRNLYNPKKKIIKVNEPENKNESILNNNNIENFLKENYASISKTKSYTKNLFKKHRIITKTLTIMDSNLGNSKIIKKQIDTDQNNKNIVSEKLNNNLKKKLLTETNEKEYDNNTSKNNIKRKLSININFEKINNNYIKKKPLNMGKRALYKKLNKPNTVRNHYNILHNTENSKDKTFNKDKNLLQINNINNNLNDENNINDIKKININMNKKIKKENEIKTKYIKIKPKEKKVNDKNRKEIIKEKMNNEYNNFIKIKKMEYIKENPTIKFTKITPQPNPNKRKSEDINIEDLQYKNNINKEKKSVINKPKISFCKLKRIKTETNDDFINNQTDSLIYKEKPKKSLHFLFQQIYKNNNFRTTFNKYFEFKKNKKENNSDLIKNDNKSTSMNIEEINLHLQLPKSSINKRESSDGKNIIKKIGYKYIYLGHNKTMSERKFFTNNKIDNSANNEKNSYTQNDSFINKSTEIDNKVSLISNNIINNQTFNTTVNFFNINNDINSIEKNNKENLEIKNYEISANIINSININSFLIDINVLYSLENKLKKILDKIANFEDCDNECYDYINYYFNNNLYDEFLKLFKNSHNKVNAYNQMKIELICIFLSYDISKSIYFNQTSLLLKTIFEIIYSNFLVIIYYILDQNNNFNNDEIYIKLTNTIKNNLKIKLNNDDMNEFNILQIINNNSKNIINYYKIILDNIYSRYYIEDDENLKFPQCIKNIDRKRIDETKLLNIKSIFFLSSYRLINTYNFKDLFNFFNIFLIKEKIDINNNDIDNNYNIFSLSGKQKYKNSFKNLKINYFLPPINEKYKYTLVLDLDETLIYLKNKNMIIGKENIINNPYFNDSILILRPGLIDFLKKMKQIYELILFSSGTLDYIMPIVNIIEKNEKFFEYILYRKHISVLNNGEYYKNLNLLNRNIKNIIIIDDMYKNFQLHKNNGICIKPFYGDIINDRNVLQFLGKILQKIRYDADVTGDIRISLQNQKNLMYSQIATNLEKNEIF